MNKLKNDYIGYFYVALAALCWSTGGLFIKLIPWGAMSINGARCFIALCVRIFLIKKDHKLRFSKTTILAGICFCLTTTFFTIANKYTTAANAVLLQYTSPLYIMLFGSLAVKKLPRRLDIVSSIIIIFGIFICCYDPTGSNGGMIGNAFALASGGCFAMVFFLNSKETTNPPDATLIGFILSSVIGMPFVLTESVFNLQILLSLLALGIVQMSLAYTLLEWGIKTVKPLTANFITTLEPVVSPIWVAIFYHEIISVYSVIGGALVIISIVGYSFINARRANVI